MHVVNVFKTLKIFTAWKVSKHEVFLVRIFLYLDWIQENTDQEKLRICTVLTQWLVKKRNTNFLKNGINHANVDLSVTLLVTFCDYAILLTINYITFIVKSSCQFRKSIFQVLRKFLEQIFSNGYRRLHMKQLNLENCLWIKDKRCIETLIWFFLLFTIIIYLSIY